jgi:hypothetical protein
MPKNYWRRVVKRAWSRTIAPFGWTKEKISGAIALVIGTFLLGGKSCRITPACHSVDHRDCGFCIYWIGFFVWSVIETQAILYQEMFDDQASSKQKIDELENKLWRSRPAPPDYSKWKHKPTLSLREAAQLWEGERPSMKLIGVAKETYEMLHGAVQSGALLLELSDPSIDPRMQETSRRMARQNPNAETRVTRDALKAFASSHNYNPDFLRD